MALLVYLFSVCMDGAEFFGHSREFNGLERESCAGEFGVIVWNSENELVMGDGGVRWGVSHLD